jgi:hypothetical protein
MPLLFLAFFAGCAPAVGNDATVYDACLTSMDVQCACSQGEGWAAGEWACDPSEAVPMCAEDAARMGGEWLEWFNCVNAEFAKECDGDAAEAACERPA